MKKSLIVIFLLSPFILFFGTIYLLNNGNPIMNAWVAHSVENHLEDTGYSEEDIHEQNSVSPKMVINKDFYHTHYRVVFNDEKDMTYYYGKEKYFGDVVQFCEKEYKDDRGVTRTTKEQTKHSEESCVSMLANRD